MQMNIDHDGAGESLIKKSQKKNPSDRMPAIEQVHPKGGLMKRYNSTRVMPFFRYSAFLPNYANALETSFRFPRVREYR